MVLQTVVRRPRRTSVVIVASALAGALVALGAVVLLDDGLGGNRGPATSTISTTEVDDRPALGDGAERAEPESTAVYAFPVRPVEAAEYGRTHHDYPATDVFAPCGSTVVAPADGVVHELSRADRWDPDVDDGDTRGGLSVSIRGDDGVRYYGSHLETVAGHLRVGARVGAGDPVGTVGSTGSARGTPCHLHLGLSPPCTTGEWWVRRGAVYPWPYLDSWRAGGQRSPVDELIAWAEGNPTACASPPG